MKHVIATIITCLAFVLSANGAKVKTGVVNIKQSDGTSIRIYGHGDESFHWYTTADNVLLYHEGYDFFIASTDSFGNIYNTQQLAHEKESRSALEIDLCNKQDIAEYIRINTEASNVTSSKFLAYSTPNLFPHEGAPHVLVLLADFQDRKFTYSDNLTRDIFDQYLNAEDKLPASINGTDILGLNRNYGSVRKYFKDMSFGKFEPQFDIYGPFHLSNNLKYYGEGQSDRMDRFIPDVCSLADNDVDFSQYDIDNDGYADLVYVIYAGYSASNVKNSSDCIWPKVGTGNFGTFDGKKVCRYGVNNELNYYPKDDDGTVIPPYINGIGLFCHEFSHALGLPDLYASGAYDNQGMEYWSLMDAGEYTRHGYRPTAYTAWEREHLGWFEITELTEEGNYTLPSLDDADNAIAYRIKNDNSINSECYILENIQKGGWNNYLGYIDNTSLPCTGMMITHVYGTDFSTYSTPNMKDVNKPRMTILPADGTLKYSDNDDDYNSMPGDLYPGINGVYDFTYSIGGYTKSIVYDGSVTDMVAKSIYDIHETDKIIEFSFAKDPHTGIQSAMAGGRNDNAKIYNLNGQQVNGSFRGIVIKDGKKILMR